MDVQQSVSRKAPSIHPFIHFVNSLSNSESQGRLTCLIERDPATFTHTHD